MHKRIVSIDYESYYGDEHHIGKPLNAGSKTIESYIRSPNFEPIMLTAYLQDEEPYVAVGAENIHYLVRQLGLGRSDTITIAHNMAFDGAITSWHFKEPIHTPVCTAALARNVGIGRLVSVSLDSVSNFLRERGYPVGVKGKAVHDAKNLHLWQMSQDFLAAYVEYGKQDSVICRQIFDAMVPYASERFIDEVSMTLRMYTNPILELDAELLEQYADKLETQRVEKYTDLARRLKFQDVDALTTTLRSPVKFAELLKSVGVEPPTKVSEKKTISARKKDPNAPEQLSYAFSKDDIAMQKLLQRGRPEVKEILEAKFELSSSISESRTKTMLDMARRGPFPIALDYNLAHTSRYGAFGGTNTQNLPKRTGDLTLRRSIKAPVGRKIGAADSSQVEARCLAYAANQYDLLDIFRRGDDPYSEMASTIYNTPKDVIYHYAKVAKAVDDESKAIISTNKTRRNVGKETILSSGYQISGPAFADRLIAQGIQFDPSQEVINAWLIAWGKEHGIPNTPDGIYNMRDALEEFKYEHHVAECVRINRLYRQKNSAIREFWAVCGNVLAALVRGENGFFGGPNNDLFFFDGTHSVFGTPVPGIRLPNGYWILYPGLRVIVGDDGRTRFTYQFRDPKGTVITKNIYGGAVAENLMQGLAFAILLWQGVNIDRQIPIALNTHDEWAVVPLIEYVEQALQILSTEMRRLPPWVPGLPLDCETSVGDNYAEC